MPSSTNLGRLNSDEWEALEQMADRFATACHNGDAPEIRNHLPPPDHRLRPFVLRELIAIEMEAYWGCGERRCTEHYLALFPELDAHAQLVVELLHEELRLRQIHQDRPIVLEYAERWPRFFPGLKDYLVERPIPGLVWDEEATLVPDSGTAATWRLKAEQVGTPRVGERVSDFEILRLLGEGSFGKVFLARQISLDRQVALKIAGVTSNEARTLASLEHDHIVQVFSETIDSARHLRLLCMQLVAGPTLEQVIAALRNLPRDQWSGRAILEVIDRLSPMPAAFHPAALRDREVLAQADFVQAVCWLGARLAEALSYAHSQGVLHRDIKPANVLLTQYGRPLLADFNVSFQSRKLAPAEGIGGTFAYMAPEHLDACNPQGTTTPEQVAERSDIYSLGVTLFELLTGQRPFLSSQASLAEAISTRMLAAPSAREVCPEVPAVLDSVLRRCLEPRVIDRFGDAAELGRALEGCRELRRMEHELPRGDRLTRTALSHPFMTLVLLGLVPQLAGSVVNITYNWVEIVSKLGTDELKQAFNQVAIVYNLAVYPLCIWLMVRQVVLTLRIWRQTMEGRRVLSTDVDSSRRQILLWPGWVVGLSALGWLPGGLVFPLGLDLLAGPIAGDVYAHFLISFTLSGLIAMTYSYFIVQFVVLRGLYPRFWTDPQDVQRTIQSELRQRGPRLGLFQLLAGVIPLSGAILLIAVGPEGTGELAFRLLAVALIVLGMAGFGLAIAANKYLARTLEVLWSGK